MKLLIVFVFTSLLGTCDGHDKVRFQRAIEIRRQNPAFHGARSLTITDDDIAQILEMRGYDDKPEERNVFVRPSETVPTTPAPGAPPTTAPVGTTTSAPAVPPSSAPVEGVTSAPITITTFGPSAVATPAPVTSAPIGTATSAPVTSTPVTSAPVTSAPVTSAPVATQSIGSILEFSDQGFSTLLSMFGVIDPVASRAVLEGAVQNTTVSTTLFAPSDAAFEALGPEEVAYFTELHTNPIWSGHLDCFLFYHTILDATITTSEFVNGESVATFAVGGVPVVLGTDPFSVNFIPIAVPDLIASNGVVHVLQQEPLQLPCTNQSIYEQSSQGGRTSTLSSLVAATSFQSVLSSERPLTLFAPTDEAFDNLSTEVLLFLINPTNVAQLEEVLAYHLLSELVFLENTTDAGTYVTRGGDSLTIDAVQDVDVISFTVQGGSQDNVATVDPLLSNILAKNGVVHLIDQVLIPPGFTIAPSTSSAPIGAPSPVSTNTGAPVVGVPTLGTIGPVLGTPTPVTTFPIGVPTADTTAPATLPPGTVVPMPTDTIAPVAVPPGTVAPVGQLPTDTTTAPIVSPTVTVAPITRPTETVAPAGLLPTDSTKAPISTPSATLSPTYTIAPTSLGQLAIQNFITNTLTDESTLLNVGTPQNAAYKSLLLTNPTLDPLSDTDQQLISQIYALNCLFFSTNFRGWRNQDGWFSATPYCNEGGINWYGVNCESSDLSQVTEIVLNDNLLSGYIPSEIRGLASLRRLELSSNETSNAFLTGEIPSTIGDMTNLEIISLHTNSLGFVFPTNGTGDPIPVPDPIPSSLSNLVNLKSFNIGNNFFLAPLAFDIFIPMSKLEDLDLSVNLFTGTFPDTVGNLSPSLTALNLDNNRFAGSIPTAIGNLVNLSSLRISLTDPADLPQGYCAPTTEAPDMDSCLGGAIPSEIGRLTNLVELWLFGNSLDGPIPTEIGNLQALTSLLMFANELSSVIPTEVGRLSLLQTLDLSTNYLGEDFTQEVFELPAIVNLNLGFNLFNNTVLPVSYAMPNIESLIMDRNSFSGQLPIALASLSTMRILNLGSNFLTGEIPSEYGNFPVLQNLTLQLNLLNSTIPTQMGQLTGLVELAIAANQFTGTIPTELGRLVQLLDMELTNNQLRGTIPTEFGNLIALKELELDINQLDGQIPTQLGQLSSLTKLRLENTLLTGVVPANVCSNTFTEFITDCGGTPPEIECSCCTSCGGA